MRGGLLVAWLAGAWGAGCAGVSEQEGFDRVSAEVSERSGLEVRWRQGGVEDAAVDEAVDALLGSPLTVDSAVQIALLSDPRLQETYERLGVAQGELVQAGLLNNPLFHAGLGFTDEGVNLELSVVQSFLDVFFIPMRKRVAAERFEEARLEVAGEVLAASWRVRRAFIEHQAALKRHELERMGFEVADAALELAMELHRVGTLSDQLLAAEQLQREQARVSLARAELGVREGRERLSVLMGLWGQRAGWRIEAPMAAIPAEPEATEGLERRAVEASLDLALARQRIVVALSEAGADNVSSVLPGVEVGFEAVREDGELELGPTVGLEVPLFDVGQGRRRGGAARVRGLWRGYEAAAIELRAEARIASMRLTESRARAIHARDVLLPLQAQVLAQTQRSYNGMLVGGFDLIMARSSLIAVETQAAEAQRDYWLARADVGLLLQGRHAPLMGSGRGVEMMEAPSKSGGHRKGGH